MTIDILRQKITSWSKFQGSKWIKLLENFNFKACNPNSILIYNFDFLARNWNWQSKFQDRNLLKNWKFKAETEILRLKIIEKSKFLSKKKKLLLKIEILWQKATPVFDAYLFLSSPKQWTNNAFALINNNMSKVRGKGGFKSGRNRAHIWGILWKNLTK